jgi:hypothetical protein
MMLIRPHKRAYLWSAGGFWAAVPRSFDIT